MMERRIDPAYRPGPGTDARRPGRPGVGRVHGPGTSQAMVRPEAISDHRVRA